MPAPANPPNDRVQRERIRIGRRIASARRHAGLSQEDLAERAGLSRQSVYRVETGVRSARLDWLIQIADALDVDLADLVRT